MGGITTVSVTAAALVEKEVMEGLRSGPEFRGCKQEIGATSLTTKKVKADKIVKVLQVRPE